MRSQTDTSSEPLIGHAFRSLLHRLHQVVAEESKVLVLCLGHPGILVPQDYGCRNSRCSMLLSVGIEGVAQGVGADPKLQFLLQSPEPGMN